MPQSIIPPTHKWSADFCFPFCNYNFIYSVHKTYLRSVNNIKSFPLRIIVLNPPPIYIHMWIFLNLTAFDIYVSQPESWSYLFYLFTNQIPFSATWLLRRLCRYNKRIITIKKCRTPMVGINKRNEISPLNNYIR